MPDLVKTILTISQRFRGQSVAWITLLLTAALPAQLAADPVLSVSDSLFGGPADMRAFRTHYPVTFDQFVDPGISSDALSVRGKAEPRADDLLKRLRSGFSIEPVINKRVQAELNWLVRHPDYVDRVFRRAQRFLPYIADQIEKHGLPFELALLPIVE